MAIGRSRAYLPYNLQQQARVDRLAPALTRIRFDRRVGGVVIGRDPRSSDVKIFIVDFDAVLGDATI